ncbi:MAG: LacI family DNA-binding transcriptional regulator [Saccharospirillaceae bacterium]|nr:LacI family transcriptional regulator [Pseudomonadales bacterium]NRB78485.1 LacI family DNA-binding transcriptional regulator [Saccharospirillaceae bacterium]
MTSENKPTVRTLDDIAKLAGVSKSTASRALNDNPLISEKTRRKIQKIAQEHNFIKHYGASSLSSKTSNTIALMVTKFDYHHPEIARSKEDPFFNKVLAGILSKTDDIGKELLICSFDQANPIKILQLVNSRKVDGVIVFGASDEEDYYSDVIPEKFPVVFWGNIRTRLPFKTVACDDYKGGKIATQTLIDSGKKKIAFIGGFNESAEVSARFEGYKTALNGKQAPIYCEGFGAYTHESGLMQMRKILEIAPDIDGVFACSDVLAMAAIRVLKQKNKNVPEDICVVGYDDIDMGEYFKPSLTTISQNAYIAGQTMVEKLINMIENPNTPIEHRTTIDVHLISRESCS